MSNANDVKTLLRRFEELQKKREEDKLIREVVEGEVIQVDALCNEKKVLKKNYPKSDKNQKLESPAEENKDKRNKLCSVL